jgi:hypothetical protein
MIDLLRIVDAAAPRRLDDLGGAWDEAMRRALDELAAFPARSKERVREELTSDRSWVLLGWGRRMATFAVRVGSRRLVVLGLLAVSLVEAIDEREALIVVPLLRRAAVLLGDDPGGVFDEAAALSDEKGGRWLTELRESALTHADMGYRERGVAETFEFEDTRPSWNALEELAPLLPGLEASAEEDADQRARTDALRRLAQSFSRRRR